MKPINGDAPILCDATSEQVQCWKYHNTLAADKEPEVLELYEEVRGLNKDAMEWAIEALVRRHESLRTGLRMIGRRLKQYILPYDRSRFSPLCLDLSEEMDTDKAVRAVVGTFIRDLRKMDAPSLVRFGILRISGDTHVLCVVIHHLIADAWSKPILYNELRRFYGAYAAGASVEIQPLDFQLRHYASWQKDWLKKNKKSAQSYWAHKLADLTDHYRVEQLHERTGYRYRIPDANARRGETLQRAEMLDLLNNGEVCSYIFSVRSSLFRQLSHLSTASGSSLQAILNTSLRLLFYYLMDKDRLLMPMLVVSRFAPGSEKLIGFLVGGIYLHRSLDPRMSIASLIKETYREFFESFGNIIFDHEEMGLDGHRLRLNTDVFVNYLKNDITGNNSSIVEEEWSHRVVDTGGYYLLSYVISEYDDGLLFNCCYHTGVYSAAMIEFMAEKHRMILQAMCESPQLSVLQMTETLSFY